MNVTRDITPRQHATILQRRCAIMMTKRGKQTPRGKKTRRGEIRVSPLTRLDKDYYFFDVAEEDIFPFQFSSGERMVREPLWAARVFVKPDHTVKVDESTDWDPMPAGVLDCIHQPVRQEDLVLLR
jgi:hypothetical protein